MSLNPPFKPLHSILKHASKYTSNNVPVDTVVLYNSNAYLRLFHPLVECQLQGAPHRKRDNPFGRVIVSQQRQNLFKKRRRRRRRRNNKRPSALQFPSVLFENSTSRLTHVPRSKRVGRGFHSVHYLPKLRGFLPLLREACARCSSISCNRFALSFAVPALALFLACFTSSISIWFAVPKYRY